MLVVIVTVALVVCDIHVDPVDIRSDIGLRCLSALLTLYFAAHIVFYGAVIA